MRFPFVEIFFWLKQMDFPPDFAPVLPDSHNFLLYEAFRISGDHILHPVFENDLLFL